MSLPELVMPGGDLEKVKIAALFGADAVYMGGKDLSLRAYAGNLNWAEMTKAVEFLHAMKKKAFITINVIAHNRDLKLIPAYLEKLGSIEPDALIVSDPGVMRLAQKYAPQIPLTVSTQANICNYESAAVWADLGAKRLVLARELNLNEIEEMRNKTSLELEVFVHGAMCVAYSGRCLLSHYMTGRGANQGACAHPCRYQYALLEEKRPGQYFPIHEDQRGSYILNSRDLCLLAYLPRLIEMGLDAFKVEGRMKSPLYVAGTARVYRQALDSYCPGQVLVEADLDNWMQELVLTATRPFTSGFAGNDSELQDVEKAEKHSRADFCGVVRAYHKRDSRLEIEQRANFGPGDPLELLLPGGEITPLDLSDLYNEDGEPIDRARHARQRVCVPCKDQVPEFSILRRVNKHD